MSNPPVLVVGGAGYIGSHTCKALAGSGFLPVAFDNFSTGHRDFIRWGPVYEGDLLDEPRLAAVIAEVRPVAAIHFAGITDVGASVRDPLLYYRGNVAASINLFRALLQGGCARLVFSSTCAVYGQPSRLPIVETTPLDPLSPYGRSKLMVEAMLRDAAAAHDFRSVVLRYFNACGADAEGQIGERHDPETHLVPRAVMAAMGRIPPIHLFGRDYPTPDGTCVRDYIHVEDLATAHIRALRYLLDGGAAETVNIGSGRGYSVAEVMQAVTRVSNLPVPFIDAPRRDGDPAELVADPGKAEHLLKFKAERSDVDLIVQSAWRWHAADGGGGIGRRT